MKRCTICHRYSCINIAVCQEAQRLQKEHSEQRKEERKTRSLEQCLYGDVRITNKGLEFSLDGIVFTEKAFCKNYGEALIVFPSRLTTEKVWQRLEGLGVFYLCYEDKRYSTKKEEKAQPSFLQETQKQKYKLAEEDPFYETRLFFETTPIIGENIDTTISPMTRNKKTGMVSVVTALTGTDIDALDCTHRTMAMRSMSIGAKGPLYTPAGIQWGFPLGGIQWHQYITSNLILTAEYIAHCLEMVGLPQQRKYTWKEKTTQEKGLFNEILSV